MSVNKLFLLILFFTVPLIMVIFNFNKNIDCEVNGLKIDESFIGMERSKVFTYLGNPKNSAIGVKDFDEFVFKINRKEFTIVVRYKNSNQNYYVSSYKCLRSHPMLEIRKYIIWH